MRRQLMLACAAAVLGSSALAADVGVSIQFSQPGVFGRVDIGQYPQPQVILSAPVIIQPPPPAMPPPPPVYLWVPLEHRQHWAQHCREYHACGEPVYFVNHDWYKRNVLAHNGRPEEHRDAERHRERGREDDERGRHRGREEEEHGRGHE